MKNIKTGAVVLLAAVLLSSCGAQNALTKPEFPQAAQAQNIKHAEVKFDLSDEEMASELPVYRVSPSPLSQTEVDHLLSVFAF